MANNKRHPKGAPNIVPMGGKNIVQKVKTFKGESSFIVPNKNTMIDVKNDTIIADSSDMGGVSVVGIQDDYANLTNLPSCTVNIGTGGPTAGGGTTTGGGGTTTGGPISSGPTTGGPITSGPTGGPTTGGPIGSGPTTGGPISSGPVSCTTTTSPVGTPTTPPSGSPIGSGPVPPVAGPATIYVPVLTSGGFSTGGLDFGAPAVPVPAPTPTVGGFGGGGIGGAMEGMPTGEAPQSFLERNKWYIGGALLAALAAVYLIRQRAKKA
jgi:hypothetical protein